jgi:RNA-directed DNA polymerase
MTFYDFLSGPEIREYLEEQITLHKKTDAIPTAEEILLRTGSFLDGSLRLGPPERRLINKLGSDKKRTIYIFPDEDLLVLKTVHFALARSDLKLLPCCLAFRPGFHVHDAFLSIIRKASPAYSCVRLDIRNFFNSIPTERVIEVVEKNLSPYQDLVAALSYLLLDVHIIENGQVLEDYGKGVMAGMPLSPLLANMYLTAFDRSALQWAPVYGRYSDDLIFFCPPEDVSRIYDLAGQEMTSLGLKIHSGKSKTVSPGEKWEFLGLSYHQGVIDLSDASILKMKGKISRAARKLYRWKISKDASTERAVRALIRKFQYKFYGSGAEDDELTWSRWYFPLINRTDGLRTIDQYFQLWARYLAGGRHRKLHYKKVPYHLLAEYGYVPLVSAYHKRDRDPAGKRTEKYSS